jgi:predicted GNAT family acetyltransferase
VYARAASEGTAPAMSNASDEIRIERSEGDTKGRYVIRLDGHEAEMTYSRAGEKLIIIDHTSVPDALGGRGVGGMLVRRAVEDARKEGKKVVPLCTFARGYIARHPDLQDVLDR